MYWTKDEGNLAELIDKADMMNIDELTQLGTKAKQKIAMAYSWQLTCDRYADVFLKRDK